MAYFDANASEPLRPEAREAVLRALDWTGNPASVHRHGRNARRTLETARETLAARFGAAVAGVVFTSGGTEANALAIHGLRGGRRVIASAVEHDAVRAAAPDAITLPVRRDGRADLDRLPELLGEAGPALVCLMLANNETGVLQPVAEAAALCRAHGALLHVDAVQAVGRVDVNLRALGAHALAVSSHKIGGPTGAGALLLAPDAPPIAAHLPGGGQESGRRGGTPALAMIAGFAAACREAVAPTETAALRDGIDRAAVAAGAQICGGDALRLPNTTCLALPGVRADTQVITLDLAGFSVSAGAACSSGKVAVSHVLTAMGLGPLAGEAIRVSLPWNVADTEVAAFSAAYAAMAGRLLRRGQAPALAPHVA